jgi:hypothetical protein
MIRYSIFSTPSGPADGEPLPGGAGGFFVGEPASADSFHHEGLQQGFVYRYAAFPRDEGGLYGPRAAAEASPTDTTAPPPPAGFHAVVGESDLILHWTHADDEDVSGTLIRYSTERFPGDPEEGIALPNGMGGRFPGEAAALDSFRHQGLRGTDTYYYAAFAYDDADNFSEAVTLSASPSDTLSPDLAFALFPNPYLTTYLDLVLIASEPLDSATLRVTSGGREIAMRRIDPAEEVWLGKTRTAEGLNSLSAAAMDLAGNEGEASGTFSAYKIDAEEERSLASSDGALLLRIPRGATREEGIVWIVPTEREAPAGGGLLLGRGAYAIYSVPGVQGEVSLRWNDSLWADVPPEEITLLHSSAGDLPSFVDPGERRVHALLPEGGRVWLARDRSAPSRIRQPLYCQVGPNRPNPFNPETTIPFEMRASQRVRLSVCTATGRHVRLLLDGWLAAGAHSVLWDGRDESGRSVASGVYIYRLQTEHSLRTGRMVLLR